MDWNKKNAERRNERKQTKKKQKNKQTEHENSNQTEIKPYIHTHTHTRTLSTTILTKETIATYRYRVLLIEVSQLKCKEQQLLSCHQRL